MVSSRRVAREWALKILYQIDVGKFGLEEARETALERLRREFVLRGSRTASGSRAEELCLEALTNHLRDTLPGLRLPLERAVSVAIGRAFQEIPYWQEIRFEKSFRHQAPGVLLDPPRLLTPLPDRDFFPAAPSTDGLAVQLAALTLPERERYALFVAWLREELPRLLDPELRKTGLALARDLARNRPLGAEPERVGNYLRERREAFHKENANRWARVGATAQKQTGDWLRTAAFTARLVNGTCGELTAVDAAIGALASGWRLERQVAVDRNILRLAGFEMLFLPGVPTSASINEAVELAKKYSTAESGRFVNGVLGALATQVGDKLTAAASPDALEAETEDDIVELNDIAEIEEIETV